MMDYGIHDLETCGAQINNKQARLEAANEVQTGILVSPCRCHYRSVHIVHHGFRAAAAHHLEVRRHNGYTNHDFTSE